MPALNIAVPDASGPTLQQHLPDRRSNWPEGATSAYGNLLGELNAWSKEFGQPTGNNAWIAETSVRQAW